MTCSRQCVWLTTLAITVAAGLPVASAENWPGWRGPARNGVSSEQRVPWKWSAERGVDWKTPLPGDGISQPIVWDDRIFVTSSDGSLQGTVHVACLDRTTGKILWHRRMWGTAPTGFFAGKSSMASPTPVTDGKFVYAVFGTGDVFSFDFDGRMQWQRSLASEYGEFENRFAHSSSPVLYGGLLLLQCDHYGKSYLLAVDPQTGANRWKVERPECWLSWSSPQLVPVGDGSRHELVLTGSEKLDGFDPRTGEKLWTIRGLSRECVPTLVYGHGLGIATSGPKGPTLAFRPGGRGDVTDSHVAWRSNRGGPFVPSGILVGDRYYIADKGIAICFDARSGKLLWQNRMHGEFYASPAAASGRAYFVNEEGETIVLDMTAAEYTELARNPIGEKVNASPAISHGLFFIRGLKHLYCVRGTE